MKSITFLALVSVCQNAHVEQRHIQTSVMKVNVHKNFDIKCVFVTELHISCKDFFCEKLGVLIECNIWSIGERGREREGVGEGEGERERERL